MSAGLPFPTDTATGLRLRPAIPADRAFLDLLDSAEEAGPFNWFDDAPADRLTTLAVNGGRVIAELSDGTRIGDLTWFGVPYGPNKPSIAWRIGITIARAHRGNGHGAVAQRLLAEHLLATTPSNRVEADTDLDNVAEQKALERAGFRREAIITAAQWRRGEWFDRVLYAYVGQGAGAPITR